MSVFYDKNYCDKFQFLSTSLFGLCLFLFDFICWKSRIDWNMTENIPTIRISIQKREIFPVYRVRTLGPGLLSASVGTRAALGVRCIKLMNSWQLRIAAWCGWYWWCLVILLVSHIWDIATGIFNIQIGEKIYKSFPNSSHRGGAKR